MMNTLHCTDLSDVRHVPISHTWQLQLLQPDGEGERFRLVEGKSTVGSSPSCQIRLPSPHVRPLHCLIVCKDQQLTVTRWAAGALINGTDFTTSQLAAGDILSVADVQLRVVGPEDECCDDLPDTESPVALIDEVEAQVATEFTRTDKPCEADEQAGAPAETADLRRASQQARQRLRRVLSALRDLRVEARLLDQHVHHLSEELHTAQQTRDQLTAELHQSQAIAAERESQYGEELDRAIAELSTSYSKVEQTEQELQALQSRNQHLQEQFEGLTAEVERLESICANHAEQKRQFEEELAEREVRLTQLADEMQQVQQNLNESLTNMRGQNAALQEQLTQVIAERDREVAELQRGLDGSLAELREENESLRSELANAREERDQQAAQLREEFATAAEHWQGENDSLRGELAELTAERNRQLAELRGENESLREKLQELAADRDARLGESETVAESLRGELAAAAEREGKLSEQRAEATNSLEAVQQHNESLRQQLADATAARDDEIEALQRAHDEALAESREELQAAREQMTAAVAEHDQQVALLEEQLEQARQAADEAHRQGGQPSLDIQELEAELSAVRGERQQLAEEKHRLSMQLEDAEKRSHLLEIDVRSVNGEWQRAQCTIARLQDELTTAQAQIADLDAKLADFDGQAEVDRAADCDRYAAELSATQHQLQVCEQELAAALAEAAEQRAAIEAANGELAASQTNFAETTRQLEETLTAAADFDDERKQLSATIADLQSQLESLDKETQQIHREWESDLAARDAKIDELSAALNEPRVTPEVDERVETERIAELTFALEQLEATYATELQARDARIGELSEEIARLAAASTGAPSEAHQQQLWEANEQLKATEEKLSRELARREAQITELSRELHETQDQLAEVAAQSERLSELYHQAQEDMAAMAVSATRANAQLPAEGAEISSAKTLVLMPASMEAPSAESDPRDDDQSRLERALASAASEVTSQEAEESTSEFQPTSFIDRYSHVFDESSNTVPIEQLNAALAETPAPALEDISGDDSAALEAYMANMMKRVRGEASSDAVVPPVAHETDPDSAVAFSDPVARMSTLTERVATPTSWETDEVEDVSLIDLQQLKGSSQKPPLARNLSALRELANISARQAIAKHRKRRHLEGALSKLLVSSIAGGTALCMLLSADDYLHPLFIAGCGVAVVSGYWGLKLLGVLLEIIRDGINSDEPTMEIPTLDDPLPIDVE